MPETYTIKISKNTGELSTSKEQFSPNGNAGNGGGTNKNGANENGANFGAAKALAAQYAKRMMQEGVSQYFDYTGNTITQRKVNEGVGLGMDFYTMASSPAGAVATIYKWVMDMINEDKRIRKANDEINAKNVTLGIVIKDGGRFNNANRY